MTSCVCFPGLSQLTGGNPDNPDKYCYTIQLTLIFAWEAKKVPIVQHRERRRGLLDKNSCVTRKGYVFNQRYKWSNWSATLLNAHSSDQLGDGCYQQNSDFFKPKKPGTTNQGAWHCSFPIPPLKPTFLVLLSVGRGFIFYLNIIRPCIKLFLLSSSHFTYSDVQIERWTKFTQHPCSDVTYARS